MNPGPRVVILGGGLSGMATAWRLLRAGFREVVLVEKGDKLGGLAGSFEKEGRFYPLGYHHILRHDRTLQLFLDQVGALSSVRWKKVRMLFQHQGRLYDFGDPRSLLKFPLPWPDKLRFLRFMLRAFLKRDWSEWKGRSADLLVDQWASPRVREALFEPLTQLKFRLPCKDLSAAWMGARLSYREGSAPLGYIPDKNWTTVLCDGLTDLLSELGCVIRTSSPVQLIHGREGRIEETVLASGERLRADLFVCALPTVAYLVLVPEDATPQLNEIRYTALISLVAATRQKIPADFYWLNLSSLNHTACAIFQLSALNSSIGGEGETCVNFVTHLNGANRSLLKRSDAELLAAYSADFESVFGFPFEPGWMHVSRIGVYSPIFHVGYENPPIQSSTFKNLYFAGVHRTFPSVASTGCALQSGLDAAEALLSDHAPR